MKANMFGSCLWISSVRYLCGVLATATVVVGVACGRHPQGAAGRSGQAEAGLSLLLNAANAEEVVLGLTDPEAVTALHIKGRVRMTPAAWRRLAACTRIREVSLVGDTQAGLRLALDGEVIRAVSRLEALEELVLMYVRGGVQEFLEGLRRPQNLLYLKIMDALPGVSGISFKRLNLAGVAEVRLEAMTLDYVVIRSLRGLPRLREVDLSGSRFPDNALEGLRDHPTLETLRIMNGQSMVGPEAIEAIATCARLESLSFGGTEVVADGLFALRDCRNLRSLFLGRTSLTRALAADLASNLRLEVLGIKDAEVEGGALDPFAPTRSLTDVIVRSLGAPAWSSLSRIASLETVYVTEDNDARAMQQFRKERPDVSIVDLP